MNHRLLRWLHEYAGDLLVAAVVLVVVLAVEYAVRSGLAGDATVAHTKETVDLAGKVLLALFAITGAVAAWRRFFKGRVLSARLKLKVSSRPVRWIKLHHLQAEGSGEALLHAVDVELENVGAATIWDPAVALKVRRLQSEDVVAVDTGSEGIERPMPIAALSGIGPGEVVVHHFRFAVPEDVPAFRVNTEVTAAGGHVWHRGTTLANAIAPSDQELPAAKRAGVG